MTKKLRNCNSGTYVKRDDYEHTFYLVGYLDLSPNYEMDEDECVLIDIRDGQVISVNSNEEVEVYSEIEISGVPAVPRREVVTVIS